MAKATTTIKQALQYQPNHRDWFASNQTLFNQVVAFYFEVINTHETVLDLSNQDALITLETLTHSTRKHPDPIMPLQAIADDIPVLFRRAAINAALGSARSFFAYFKTWKARKAKAEAKGKTYPARPPVPPRTWKKAAPFYRGQWKERTKSSIVLKVWTGTCWSWVKVRTLGREVQDGTRDHLSLHLGTQMIRGMAPPTRERSGWTSLPHLFLPNYGSSASSLYETHTQKADYRGAEEAAVPSGRAECHWIKNARHSSEVQVRSNTTQFAGKARFITSTEEDTLARQLVYDKYAPRESDDLTGWARTSLPLAIDLIL